MNLNDNLVILQICPILPCKLPVSNLRLCPDHRLPRLVVRHTLWLSSLPQLGQVQISHFSAFKYLIACVQVVFGLSFRRFSSTNSPPASDHSLSAVELNRLSTMEVKNKQKSQTVGMLRVKKHHGAVALLTLLSCGSVWSGGSVELWSLWSCGSSENH